MYAYLMQEALDILPVVTHSGLLNANLCSVAEQRQQLSVEYATAWGAILLECSHALQVIVLGCSFVDCVPDEQRVV